MPHCNAFLFVSLGLAVAGTVLAILATQSCEFVKFDDSLFNGVSFNGTNMSLLNVTLLQEAEGDLEKYTNLTGYSDVQGALEDMEKFANEMQEIKANNMSTDVALENARVLVGDANEALEKAKQVSDNVQEEAKQVGGDIQGDDANEAMEKAKQLANDIQGDDANEAMEKAKQLTNDIQGDDANEAVEKAKQLGDDIHIEYTSGIFCSEGFPYNLNFRDNNITFVGFEDHDPQTYLEASRVFACAACILGGLAVLLQMIRVLCDFSWIKHLAGALLLLAFIATALMFLYFGVFPSGNYQWADGAIFAVSAAVCFLLSAVFPYMYPDKSKKLEKFERGSGHEDAATSV